MMRTSSVAAFALLVLALGQTRAEAQVKPFKMTGGGLAPFGLSLIPGTPAYHDATGVATELGAYSGKGFFTLIDATEFKSAPEFEFIAANGDKLVVTYGDVDNHALQPGQVTVYPIDGVNFYAVFVAEFNPVVSKCTGRFAKLLGGTFTVVATSGPFAFNGASTTPFTYTWEGEGILTFRKGK